ncbi:mechanosensitive ion channel family protein [Pedobacter sp.]|nr:mechanosensitive ion channel family protein [Candidatus Saccharibacteria bacterium]
MSQDFFQNILAELNTFISGPNAMRSLIILLFSVALTYWLSRFVALAIVRVAQFIATRSDNTTNEEKKIQLRRIETYLSVAIALTRALIVGIVAFYTWQILSPSASLTAATFGASAFFIVVASATVGMILRDITAGATMIIERWFAVGDFVRIEPFMEVAGVVERMTLRSTKLRSLNGEIVWLHNQHIQAVKVTPHGLRTIAVDVFMNDENVGKELIQRVISTIPIGTMTVTSTPKITRCEKWAEGLWMFSIVGQTPPGREWMMENYFVDSLKELDKKRRGTTLIRQPLVRYADPAAERSFKRAVRMGKKA